MITYQLNDSGVTRKQGRESTFIRNDASQPAWHEYLTWRALGNIPLAATPRRELTRVLIVGAGAYGRELLSMSKSAIGHGSAWQVAGFLNDIPDSLDAYPGLPPIVGSTDHEPCEGEVFICAIGEAAGRRKVCEKLEKRGAVFMNLTQESVMIAASATFGHGVIMECYTGVGANSRVGDFTTILTHANIAHDVKIGRFVQISPFAAILGWAEIGDEVTIGTHAVILPHVKVGARATVGAGSVVIKDVPPGATVFGSPAVRIQ
jgi:sugar O-acyltransferase (sialic acid O-acetyltransferase NeuD family)